jgi:hypothetical protein
MYSKLVSIVFASLFLVSAAASAQQSASSGLAGQVTDSSQASVPGATVTVTNIGTNAQRIAVTDDEGRFAIPALPPAAYHINVSSSAGKSSICSTRRTSDSRTGTSTTSLPASSRARTMPGTCNSVFASRGDDERDR